MQRACAAALTCMQGAAASMRMQAIALTQLHPCGGFLPVPFTGICGDPYQHASGSSYVTPGKC